MLHKKKILVADDEVALRSAIADKLNKEGFHVISASDGNEALTLALKEKPDLILLDMIMPEMDGVTVLQELRQDEWGINVPVIIISNSNPDDINLSAITEGHPSFYLIKANFSLEELIDKVRMCLG
jgi:CheY-like chemotaxis protein